MFADPGWVVSLGTKEGEKDIFKLAKMRERKSRDLHNVKCTRSDDRNMFVKTMILKKGGENILISF